MGNNMSNNMAKSHIEWRISQLEDKGLDGFNKLSALEDLQEIKKLVDNAIKNAPKLNSR
tara:strand:- start:326 stop:502 length:177 start_codon:yes stop_codon:yes gene_type:complete